ncbi:MAG: large subunit ribosomal protein L24 [Candidatus Azotimanducaceae bacterium]|jgi:large subunit ribosomal protein L24
MKIKKGDEVIIIAGKDKGKKGNVIMTIPTNDQVIVEGVNVVTKHQKNKRARSQGQIIEKSAPVHVSNVSLMEGGKAVRTGYKMEGEGKDAKKVRIARPSGATV